MLFRICIYTIFILQYGFAEDTCSDLSITITQKIENEGFHREIKWLVEIPPSTLVRLNKTGCQLSIRLNVPPGMYVNPDEISDIIRSSDLLAYIDGEVNVETPMHESTPHNFYIYLENDSSKVAINFPIHLRYQRAQITGGYGKVQFRKPSLLLNCSKDLVLCKKLNEIKGPCDFSGKSICIWNNITYEALFDDVELYVPIGDQDDYPLVSIVTLLLGCFGTIYILSLLSSAPL